MPDMKHNYQLHHVLIAQLMTLILLLIQPILLAIIIPALFYTAREIYQYAIGKRHNGRFDWGGCVPVIISQFLIGAIWYL
jgi:hypothetical protein